MFSNHKWQKIAFTAALYLTILACLRTIQVLDAHCLPFDLPKGVKIFGLCGYQSQDVCNAVCRVDGTVIWKEKTMCLPKGKWTPLPTCQKVNTLELIRCNKLSEITQKQLSACFKVKVSIPGPVSTAGTVCPKILQLFVKFGNCQNEPRTDCAVSCRNKNFVLLCMVNSRWSSQCNLPAPLLCPELKYAELFNCSRVPGISCKVRCPNGKIPKEETVCLETYEWSPLPSCYFRSQCARQRLPTGIRFLNSTCKNSNSLYCQVGCLVRFFSLRKTSIVNKLVFIKDAECQPSGYWNALPDCEKVKKVFWEESSKRRKCPKPKFHKNVILLNNCSTSEGSVCRFKCKKGFHSKGENAIRCFNRHWIGGSKCEPLLCPPLPGKFKFNSSCGRTVGSACDVQCKRGKTEGKNTVFCNLSRYWSAFPRCVPLPRNYSCPRKISPYISFVNNCSFINASKCQVRCRNMLSLVGLHIIKCQKGIWRNIPQCFPEKISPYRLLKIKCSFPPPLYGNLKVIGYCKPNGGVSCDVGCRDASALMTGPNATTCLPPGLWSKIKPCSGGKLYCSKPRLRKYLEMTEDCLGKEVGSRCRVRCKHRPAVSSFIICLKDLKWSAAHNCSCPFPLLSEGMKFEENCTYKQPGEVCSINCRMDFLMVGGNSITCTRKLQWSSLPSCRRPPCPKPKLSNVLTFKENCTSKYAGDYCSLKCKEGGKAFNSSKIRCIDATHWTVLPKCACPPPLLSGLVESNHNCNEILPGQKCFLSCKNNLSIISKNYITCQSNTRWSITPECRKKFCPKPVLTYSLMYDEDCTLKEPGEHCQVACREHSSLLQSTSIICINGTHWSPFPICTCPSPLLPDFLETTEDCNKKIPGEHCALICKENMKIEGDSFITCQNNTRWNKTPKCKKHYCTRKQLPRILMYSGDCTSVSPGKKCLLECREGGKLEGPNFITCINQSQWTSFPTCLCPAPYLSDDLIAKENCDAKHIGEKCHLKCKKQFSLIGENFLVCRNNTRWSFLPRCKKFPCIKLKLPSGLDYKEDCSSKLAGEHCQVECKEGGKLIGPQTLTCVNGTQWTAFPKCTCPSPNLNDQLISTEDCSSKLVGETCTLRCKVNHSTSEREFIICGNNSRWSILPECKTTPCIRPKLSNLLAYAEDCTSKLPGESCFLECKRAGEFIGLNKITCINTTKWSDLPTCTCPLPFLTEDLFVKEKCNRKSVGEKCQLSCRKHLLLIGENFITCMIDTRWSPLPKCKKLVCPKPKLNNVLSFREDCSSKTLKERCDLECREGGVVIGLRYLTCENGSTGLGWTPLPRCACPIPPLSEGLQTLEDCHGKRPGEVCRLKCSNKLTIVGRSSILCRNNTKWSLLPKCERTTCFKPKLPHVLMFQEDCSSKAIGESCLLDCRTGGKALDTNEIICLESRSWTVIPECACPPPIVSNGIKLLEDCSTKRPGEHCHMTCEKNLTLDSYEQLICKNDTLWNFQPNCRKDFCRKPNLPDSLMFEEDCTSKVIGDKCLLACKLGGKIIGENSMQCLATDQWTSYPECSCPTPHLQGYLETNDNCSFKAPGEICSLKCKNNLTIVGKNFIICKNDTQWSNSPTCEKIICLEPVIPSGLVFLQNCSEKFVSSTCKLGCKYGGNIIGSNVIKCLNKTSWTDFPTCTCPKTNLTVRMISLSNCSYKIPGEKCYLTCKKNLKLVGHNFIQCQVDGKWSNYPKCVRRYCKGLQLPNTLVFDEDCSLKVPGEKCRLICKEGGQLLGDIHVTCLNKSKWSTLPDCTCPKPNVTGNLEAKENCSNKKRNEKCILGCAEGYKIIGSNNIICQNNTKWSAYPSCTKVSERRYCKRLQLPITLGFDEDCSFKVPGEKCRLKCKQGGNLLGDTHVTCLNPSKWSNLPDCTCPKPNVTGNLEVKENCSNKKRNEKCILGCAEGYKIIGSNNINCQNNTKWSAYPSCTKVSEKRYCKRLQLPITLVFDEDCSSKVPGEKCRLKCEQGGNLLGDNRVTCLNPSKWSNLPDCTCPRPNVTDNLEVKENCSNKKRNEKCILGCAEGYKIIGSNNINCQNNTKWSAYPSCTKVSEKRYCKRLQLPITLVFDEDCSSKVPGEKCRLKCEQGGNLLGDNRVTCLNPSKWSNLPDCTCPRPNVTDNLEVKENCSNKKRNEKCILGCAEGYKMIGLNNIICQNNTKWSAYPSCTKVSEKRYCKRLQLPITLVFDEDCSSKVPGEKCRLKCKQGGNLLGDNRVACLNLSKWSKLPDCTCPRPNVTGNLEVKENCNNKKRNEKCILGCAEGYKMIGLNNIICQNNTKWSAYPSCTKVSEKRYCKRLQLPITLVFDEDCTSKVPGEKCRLKCKQGGNLLGDNRVACLNLSKWSKLPDCTCPRPNVTGNLEVKENCNNKKRNEKCILGCAEGYKMIGLNNMMCQNNTKWSAYPSCVKISCPDPELIGSKLKFEEHCTGKSFGDTCKLSCKEKGHLVGKDFIRCLKTSKWSTFPDCTCAAPLLTPDLETKNNCSFLKQGEKCFLKCEKGLELDGRDFIVCQSNTKWSLMPKCIKILCPLPTLPEDLVFNENCSSKKIGEECQIRCKNNGNVVGRDKFRCLAGRRWSTFPECTCPRPNATKPLRVLENCDFKRKRDKCKIGCTEGFRIKGAAYITCLNTTAWSVLPICLSSFCPEPVSEVLKFKENCTLKSFGGICKLGCKQGGHLIGSDFIKCTDEYQWSSFPDCTCPSPILNDNLRTKQECNFIKRGEKCFLECDKNLKLNGNDFILCQNNTKWDLQPRCVKTLCPKPHLTHNILVLAENCSTKTVGDTCQLRCIRGGSIVGHQKIKCLSNFTWTSLPACTCPKPDLIGNIVPKENCTHKKINEKCILGCLKGYKIIGVNYIICQNNTNWSPYPSCSKLLSCPNPVLLGPNLEFKNCTDHFLGAICHLSCKRGGLLIGKDFIECLGTRKWSSFPDCTCPAPRLSSDIETKNNCTFLRPGEKCFLKCKGDLKINGRNFVVCQNDTKWSTLPTCGIAFCPIPNLSGGIHVLGEDCSKKEISEECKIHCKAGGHTIGSDHIKCLKDFKWSAFPQCTCPQPKITTDIELKEDCGIKQISETCWVECSRQGFKSDLNYIVCQSNTEWSPLPECVRTFCPIPDLSRGIHVLEEDCSNKRNSEECKISCKTGGRAIGIDHIKCLEDFKWSALPECTCPLPQLTIDRELKEDCGTKQISETCWVECSSQGFKSDQNYIVCQSNTEWSPLPECVRTFCPIPDFPTGIYYLTEDCSNKRIFEECKINCLLGGRTIETDHITCSEEFEWSTLPQCSCPVPEIEYDRELNEACEGKRPSEMCLVQCKKGGTSNENYIICQTDTRWTDLPGCALLFCPIPDLSRGIHVLEEDCSRKAMDGECRVNCKQGGSPIGSNVIKCLDGIQWSALPECTCPPPIITDDMEIKEDCRTKQISESCWIECKQGLKSDQNYIVCQSDTTWSPLPVCLRSLCPIPDLSRGIYVLEEDCSKKEISEECKIICKEGGRAIGSDHIKCLEDATWSALPECTCPEPPKNVWDFTKIIKEDCSTKQIGERCWIECSPQFYSDQNYAVCQSDTLWSPLPDCIKTFCPIPDLPTGIYYLTEDCSNKRISEECKINCLLGGHTIGIDHITCSEEFEWSTLPQCSCPVPEIEYDRELNEACEGKRPSEMCLVQCKKGGTSNENYIICQTDTRWTALPGCALLFCPIPDLSRGIHVLEEDCSRKAMDGECRVNCKQGGSPIGSNVIKCLDGIQWSALPECTCPPPIITDDMDLKEDCRTKRISESCWIECKQGLKSDQNYIVCQSDTTWSPLPECVGLFCPIPDLSGGIHLLEEDCSQKAHFEVCKICCKQGGNLVGSNHITCLSNGKWSPLPECTCPPPKVTYPFKVREDCKNKRINDTCLVGCIQGFKSDQNFISCQTNTRWNLFPECVRSFCPVPKLSGGIHVLGEDCSKKAIFEECRVKCKEGGVPLGTDLIRCLTGFTWSTLPECTCPPPVPTYYMDLREDCRAKRINETCWVACKEGLISNQHYIFCQTNTKWSALPVCIPIAQG